MSQGMRRRLTPNLSQETLGDLGSQNSARQRLVPAAGTPADPGPARPQPRDRRGPPLPPPDGGSAAQGNAWSLPGPDEVSIKVESPAEEEAVSAKGKPRSEPRHRFTFRGRASKKKPLQAAPLEQTEPGTPRLHSLADSEPDGLEASGSTLPLTNPDHPGVLPDNLWLQREATSDVEPLQPEALDRLSPEGPTAEISNGSSWLADQESLLTSHLGTPTVLEELAAVREAQQSLELSVLGAAESHQQQLAALEELLQDERQRSRRLQAQLRDLMDLHLNELNKLKDNLANLEEKIAYQAYESSRDIWEVLETIQSKLLRLEHLQLVSQADGPDQPSRHELLSKSMNLLLMLTAMALMVMSTLSALVMPFVRTRTRTLTTCALFLLLLWVWGNWDSFRVQPATPKFLRG